MSKRILIVEDDAAFHILYDAILDNAGYRITHAYDGNEAFVEPEVGMHTAIFTITSDEEIDGEDFLNNVISR